MAGQITTLLSAERRLLQDVSHELRSPLARLGFAVELAKTSPDREAALARIRQEADRLAHLVDELLQLTRAEGDPAARILEEVDLGELLRRGRGQLRARSRRCKAAGWMPKIDTAAVLTGDFELLRRACDNVLRNAIRHAPKGTAVAVRAVDPRPTRHDLDPRPRPRRARRCAVRDLQAVLPRRNDRGRSSGGVGLGLAIASRAVELHQGKITARNANPGLLVEIELPTGQ